MRPGIIVQHARVPSRAGELVRSDIAGFIGFIHKDRWPEGASPGDYTELVLRRTSDLWDHPDRSLFDPASVRAVRSFFENGGDTAHLFGVCIRNEEDLLSPSSTFGVLASLFDRLRAEDDIALLAVPAAAYFKTHVSRKGDVRCDCEVVYDELLAHCREMNNRFLIMDAPQGLHGEPLVRWVNEFSMRHLENRSYGAVYYPWLMRGDELFPPSGVMVGLFAQVELERKPIGLAWPPANIPLKGVTHPEVELDWDQAGELAGEHINPFVIQPGRGVLAFGARTLSRDITFRNINSRRIVNFVGEQLRRDNQWAVFETNNPHLWDVLERDVRARLGEFWNAGLLTGDSGNREYNVRCDAGLNPLAVRNAGEVHVEVSIRPVGTAEQITIDLSLGSDTVIGGG